MNETVLACATQFNLYGITRSVGDLYFTSRRVLFATTGSTVLLNFAGMVGTLVGERESRDRSQKLLSQPITAIEAATRPDYQYAYVDLESIVVKSRWLRSSLIIVQPRNGKRRKFHGRRPGLTEVVNRLSALKQAGAPIELR